MFYKHLIIENDNEKTLYLFIDFNYEFSTDFHLKGKKGKAKTFYENALNYIRDKKIDFKGGKVLLVVGGLVIGSLFIQGFNNDTVLNDPLNPPFKYVEQVDVFGTEQKNDDIFIPPSNSNKTTASSSAPQVTIPEVNTHSQTTTGPTTPVKVTTQQQTQTSTAPQTQSPTTQVAPTPPPTTTPAPPPTTQPSTVTSNEQYVTLYRYNGTVEQISLEDYVTGVVGAEMPASFNNEALKAQSVLARTYALKKINSQEVLKDSTSNQVYKDQSQLKAMWGSDFQTYYNKIKSAVTATKGQYLAYNGSYIEAVYHSTSNGQTEDSAAVWGNSFPYLKSVDSHWDLDASSYLRETPKDFNLLSSIIGINFNDQTNVEILSKTAGNRVNEIKIGDSIFSGIELRNLLGLRSADFDIKVEGNQAIFVTRGYGHGVGMSQYGANGMAKEGYTYRDILSHYYPGTQLKN